MWVFKDNVPGRGFYEKHGYAVIDKEMHLVNTGIFKAYYIKELA